MVRYMHRILIIDDEDDIREVASLSLEATAGWKVLTANSGAQGIELLLTAKVQGIDKRRFADLGVAAVLFKPFDPLTLADQIAEALGWNSAPPSSHRTSPSTSAPK